MSDTSPRAPASRSRGARGGSTALVVVCIYNSDRVAAVRALRLNIKIASELLARLRAGELDAMESRWSTASRGSLVIGAM